MKAILFRIEDLLKILSKKIKRKYLAIISSIVMKAIPFRV